MALYVVPRAERLLEGGMMIVEVYAATMAGTIAANDEGSELHWDYQGDLEVETDHGDDVLKVFRMPTEDEKYRTKIVELPLSIVYEVRIRPRG